MDRSWTYVAGAVGAAVALMAAGAWITWRTHCWRREEMRMRRDRAYVQLCDANTRMRDYIAKHGCRSDDVKAQRAIIKALWALQVWRSHLPADESGFSIYAKDVLEYILPANRTQFPL